MLKNIFGISKTRISCVIIIMIIIVHARNLYMYKRENLEKTEAVAETAESIFKTFFFLSLFLYHFRVRAGVLFFRSMKVNVASRLLLY